MGPVAPARNAPLGRRGKPFPVNLENGIGGIAMSKFELRKDGKVFSHWEDPSLTPDKDTLRSMKAAGYRLYIDGKLQR